MTAKAPPVPPEQQSTIIKGQSSPPSTHPETKQDPAGGDAELNLHEQGRWGNTNQNLTHQGRQQDR